MATIEGAIAAARKARDAKDAKFMKELVLAYKDAWESLQPQWDVIQAGIEAGKDKAWLQTRVAAYQTQLEDRMNEYAKFVDERTRKEAMQAIADANPNARKLISSVYSKIPEKTIYSSFHSISEEQLVTSLGMTQKGSPLFKVMAQDYGPTVAKEVGRVLSRGIALGWHPTVVQRELDRQFGTALQWSMAASRTFVNQTEWRTTGALYQANRHLLSGWYWVAALDDNTCLACALMSGTWHPVTETLNDHYAGRCMMVPAPRTYRSLGIDVDGPPKPRGIDGWEWLRSKSPEQLQKLMGPGRYNLWASGKLRPSDFVTFRKDPVYGRMLAIRPLKDFVRTKKGYRLMGDTPAYLTLRAVRKELVHKPVEWGALINPKTGRVVATWTDNIQTQISSRGAKGVGMIYVHNHPLETVERAIAPLSPADVAMATRWNQAEIWAVSVRGDSRMVPATSEGWRRWFSKAELTEEYNRRLRRISFEWGGRPHKMVRWDQVVARIWYEVAPEYGMRFDWMPR